ncbi:hypothetical protein GQ44DRAFT_771749 [Phaeosphaeriaceae sp. PMI808]|nr:hypothetical protein GQ44DRAFT_771749 [Phaeosphaeriaceae sp. PMI808]
MRSYSLLIAFLFALVATSFATAGVENADFEISDFESSDLESRGNRNSTKSNGGNTVKGACKTMKKLMRITQLASNQTKLDSLVSEGKLTTAKVDELKKKAADAGPKLQAMSTNTTLATECTRIAAESQMKGACKQMKKLQKMADLVKNQTALDAFAAKHKLNGTRVDKLKAKVQKSQPKLTELSSNTTLTTFCAKKKSVAADTNGGRASGSASASATGASQTSTASPNTPAAAGNAQQVKTNGASGAHVTTETLPYIFVTVLAGVFVLLL